MTVHNSLLAARPEASATVSASAGSGKTWLLVTRIIRLLLAGAQPGTILALTFTRKAAAEMQLRLNERLYAMATAADSELDALLETIGEQPGAQLRTTARGLYEQQLHALHPVRLCTFHSFCQDILARFPLEADIPPGFDLLEDTSLLQQQAWQTLFTEATREANGQLAQDLDFLMLQGNGPANTRTMLNDMLRHRSDWWAYTENATNPAQLAGNRLQQQLDVNLDVKPGDRLFTDSHVQMLRQLADLLRLHATKTNIAAADCIDSVLRSGNTDESALNALKTAFLTQAGEPLKTRKPSGKQKQSMGEANEALFLQLNEKICQTLLECIDCQKKQLTLKINQCWYRAGQRYIEIFQRLKRELRSLDFNDLEWKCYQLLNASDNALWVQYKIDQHIDHILIDEFQDTNPTQWHLLSPLLEEIAASPEQRWRSVFLVGDEKQSIYSFRRANPRLQARASDWLQTKLAATATPLDFSWRSSPAIIEAVNRVFTQPAIQPLLPDYVTHDTHLKQLPGQVSVLPLFNDNEQDETTMTGLRNPLLQPRPEKPAGARHHEAECIADKILSLLENASVNENGIQRALMCDDIMILLRNRTHIDIYQDALRRKGIAFISNRRGGLLDNLEIRDMERLIDTLITPYNNLALAQVLRSPLFSADDEHLLMLAAGKDKTGKDKNNWYQRLLTLAENNEVPQPLQRAARLLPRWRALADTIPVHDLLDRIYAEGNVIARYRASVSGHEQQRVASNLQRFLELSLELDSGRYPSLSHFVHYCRNMRAFASDSLDEPAAGSEHSPVRIMTIHGSKGLEAPVVFVADCNSAGNNRDSYTALVDWPEHSQRPQHFLLMMTRTGIDSMTDNLLQAKAAAQAREQLNLLYVALTRARQYLFISGAMAKKGKQSGWYTLCHDAIQTCAELQPDGELVYRYGDFGAPDDSTTVASTVVSEPDISEQMTAPIAALPERGFLLAPSHIDQDFTAGDNETDGKGRLRGIAIHRALDLLTRYSEVDRQYIHKHRHRLLGVAADDSELERWLREAEHLVDDTRFNAIFRPAATARARNEYPVLYRHNDQDVYGIIDRIVIDQDAITIIDYKTHISAQAGHLDRLAEPYRRQLRYYREGVQCVWPDMPVRAGLLFTHCAEMVWLDE